MNNFNDISHIENYLLGRMPDAERKAFEAELSADALLRQEVEAYQKIFSGFSVLKEEAFAVQVAQWAKAAPSQNHDNIVPINKGATIRTLWRRVAVAASVVLLLGVAAAWWASQQYGDEKLVAAAYAPPLAAGTMGGPETQASELEKQFEAAHGLFQKGSYADAANGFNQVAKTLETNPALFDNLTRKFYLDNARWTGLLAQFAAGQLSDEAFSQALNQFADDPASDYAAKAKELKKDMGSIWRKIGG
ncbi:MAG: hypothetical protein H6577_00905 [Lewinellaceae bacterium]|nr:hypothetical protein [Saprospiraceae bacterium]MCB9336667.1 hypothetical protein [Lewinellaceae bacterium]